MLHVPGRGPVRRGPVDRGRPDREPADGTPADWVLITGTNGKTTTTQLTAAMLAAGGLRAAPVGNIGVPVLDAVRDPAGFDRLMKAIERAREEKDAAELRWLELAEQVEALA